jgi:hypothetical protein
MATLAKQERKTAADAARLFKIHPATVSRLLARDAGSSPGKAADLRTGRPYRH